MLYWEGLLLESDGGVGRLMTTRLDGQGRLSIMAMINTRNNQDLLTTQRSRRKRQMALSVLGP